MSKQIWEGYNWLETRILEILGGAREALKTQDITEQIQGEGHKTCWKTVERRLIKLEKEGKVQCYRTGEVRVTSFWLLE